jgi:DNA-binding transcriptional ArsR family regulator
MVKYKTAGLDATFMALSDPTRRRLLERLSRGQVCVTDLARPFSISLPAISRHLCVLEKAGLLKRKRRGRRHELKLNAAPMKAAVQWIVEYRRFWEGSLDALAAFLENSGSTKQNERKTKS